MKLFLGQYPVRLTDTHRLNPAVANISLAADIDRIMEADLNVHFRLVPENNLLSYGSQPTSVKPTPR